jgi:hypothetical protein
VLVPLLTERATASTGASDDDDDDDPSSSSESVDDFLRD